jgi:D-glycero-D-manno-heptose 1,7-bisphosphate phosphatase
MFTQVPTRGALFLDRDGVINVDHGYVHRREQFDFIPGIFELARFWTREVGWPIVVVSNQSGIGRGYFDEAAHGELTRFMCERFAAEGAAIARAYHCPYHPLHGIGEYRREHPWRKPGPGMILQAAADLALDLAQSVIVGDRSSDMAAGAAAGVPLRVLVGAGGGEAAEVSCRQVGDLAQALDLIRSHVGTRPQQGPRSP